MTEHSLSLEQLAKVKDGTGHSIYGASGSPIYLACSGSLIPNILAPDDAGYDAAWGTVAHSVTEQWLREDRRPSGLLGDLCWVGNASRGFLIEIDEEMLENAGICVDWCEWEPGEHLIEHHVDFSHLTPIPNQGGTLDFAALSRGIARTTDHKFGASPENIVMAEDNPQLMLYSIGLWRDPRFQHYGFKDFVIRVLQPRLDHFDEWHTTTKRLAEFEDYCRERMALAWQFDAPRTPGPKQCRFCKVRASCAANAKLQEDLVSIAFGVKTQTTEQMQDFVQRLDHEEPFMLHFRSANDLTTDQMAKLLPFKGMAKAWWDALNSELMKRAQQGDVPTGMKIVDGRSRRYFKDKDKSVEHLMSLGVPRDEILVESLVTPAKAEKALRAHGHRRADLPGLLEGLVGKPPGKATLVPLSDPRPEVEDMATVAFNTAPTETDETEDY
jgi:hypothetical protein